jgi:hypothetical protein
VRRSWIALLIVVAAAACSRPKDPADYPPRPDGRPLFGRLETTSPEAAPQLKEGFFPIEGTAPNLWRWTKPSFTVELGPPRPILRARFTIPDDEIKQLTRLTVRARVGDAWLAPETYEKPGLQEYVREVPAHVMTGRMQVEVKTDKAYRAGGDSRDLGLIVHSIGFDVR